MDSQKPSRDEALLVSVAESVGSTLGTLAAKATAFQKALTPNAKPRKRRRTKTVAKPAARKRKPAARKPCAGLAASLSRTAAHPE